MKRWIALAAHLYPAAWRKRYGSEFQALLEDVNPGWWELFDVIGGATKMQLTTSATYLKLGVAFALAGLVVAGVASFMIPKEYTSTAVLRISDDQGFIKAEQNVLSRTSLSEMIQDPALNLYASERAEQPLEDVIEYVRSRNIHISVLRNKDHSAAATISFRYPDKQKAQAVVRALITKFSVAMEPGKAAQNLEILDPPSLPLFATSPKRDKMLLTGLTGGLLLGLIAAVFIKHPRRALVFTSLGLGGCLLGGSASMLIPNRYISKAVIRVVPFDHNFEQALNRIARPGLRIQVIHLNGTPEAAAVELMFQDTSPERARGMVSSAISALTVETVQEQMHGNIEMLDNANLPLSPVYPNRMVISVLGFCVGLVIATMAFLLQRRNRLKHA